MSDIKQEYAASSALTITLGNGAAGLATSTTHVFGRESTAIDNTSLKYLDYLLGGIITTGTTPTVNTEIRVYVIGQITDAPLYPDVFDGTDSDETWTNVNIRDSGSKLAAVMTVTAISNVGYWFGPVSVRALFGGNIPKRFIVWVTHNTAVNLNLTAANHVLTITPTYETVT